MSIEHAILTSLAERPGTGYELSRQFDRSIGHFWSATHQQTYKTLKKLHDQGLVEFQTVPQDGRPDKKVYTLSEAGRRELRDWVGRPAGAWRLRDELSVKIRAASFGDVEAVIATVKARRELFADYLAAYEGYADEFPDPASLHGSKLHRYLVLRGGITLADAMVAWCDEVIAGLESDRVSEQPPGHDRSDE